MPLSFKNNASVANFWSKTDDRTKHNLLFTRLTKCKQHVHSWDASELIKEADHAHEVGYLLFRPCYCNQWGETRELSINRFTFMNSQFCWACLEC